MKTSHGGSPSNGAPGYSRWAWILPAGCLLVLILALWQRSRHRDTSDPTAANTSPTQVSADSPSAPKSLPTRLSGSRPAQTAEEIVAGKVQQFGKSRREIARGIRRRLNKEVPPEVEKFFDAVDSGNWEEIDAQWQAMAKRKQNDPAYFKELGEFWAPVFDAYGAAEQAHLWTAQKLLDYGNAILGSLRPGMVYVGGTDAGRFIPTLLNETGEGEPHLVVTQNALADGTYLDYLRFRYADRINALSEEDSQNSFTTYLQDAQKRLQHDQEFPNEPTQLRPGEEIKITDNRVQVSGQVAVMAINESLLQKLLEKNPDASFALEESTSLKSFYGGA